MHEAQPAVGREEQLRWNGGRTVEAMRTIDTGTDDLLAAVDEGVATLTMNRPERRNAMSGAMNEALARVLAEVEVDDDVGCVVLTGAGGAFCAGGDVKGMASGGDARRRRADGVRRRRAPPAAQPAGDQPAAVRDAEADDRRAARCRRRRRAVARAGLRPPLRGAERGADHGVRQGRLRRRLRRHVVPHPARRQRQGPRALLLLRQAERGGGRAPRHRQRHLPGRDVRRRGRRAWPAASPPVRRWRTAT